MSKRIVIVRADTNDADYVTCESELDEWGEALVKKVAAAIKQKTAEKEIKDKWNPFDNWPTSEYRKGRPEELYRGLLTEEEVFHFNDCFCPHGEYGIHTIESIRILTVVEEERLF